MSDPNVISSLQPGEPDGWEEFRLQLEALGGELVPFEGLQERLKDRTCFVDGDALPRLSGLTLSMAEDVWQADVGITMADAAVAETGSLLIRAGEGRARMASLAPPVHLALVPRDRLVPSLDQALEIAAGATSVLITGPSRTADIEGVLVRGVHGPGQLWVVPLG